MVIDVDVDKCSFFSEGNKNKYWFAKMNLSVNI